MKKNRFLNKFLFALCLPILILGCSDDDISPSTDFSSIASTYLEGDGTRTITIPLRNAGGSIGDNVTVAFAGTATEGKDFSLVGITAEGVQISIIDDTDLESNETIRVELVSSSINLNGNNIHTITIVSNCEDIGGLELSAFAGDFSATEKYGPTSKDWYGPYDLTMTQDETDPSKFWLDNFYDSGLDAYVVVDTAAGTAYFPNQKAGTKQITASTGVFGFCVVDGHLTLTLKLNYDGGNWEYQLVKH